MFRFGLSEEELKNPVKTMFSGGVMKAYRTSRAVAVQRWRKRDEEMAQLTDLAVNGRDGGVSAEELRQVDARLRGLRFEKETADSVPLWQHLTGMYPEAEDGYDPNERQLLIVRFLCGVEKVLRFEVRTQANRQDAKNAKNDGMEPQMNADERRYGLNSKFETRNPKETQNSKRQNNDDPLCRSSDDERHLPLGKGEKTEAEWDAEVVAARTYRWDPLALICRHFGIAQRRLSMFAHEALGMSASELVDKVRAESVRDRMKRELKEWMVRTKGEPQRHRDTEGEGNSNSETRNPKETENDKTENPSPRARSARVGPLPQGERDIEERALEVLDALKKWRRGRWHRASWALEYGFASYQRMFRGCLFCYGKTPQELELEVIGEILEEDFTAETQRAQRTDGIQNEKLKMQNDGGVSCPSSVVSGSSA